MPIDPSAFAQFGQGVTPLQNPLAQQAQVAQTANALMGVRERQAKQAAGQAFQQSIGPDGTTNQPALLKNLAADPNAAMEAQASATSGQALSTAEYAQHITKLSNATAGAAQLLAANPNGVPYSTAKAYFDSKVQDGTLTAADEQSALAGFGGDPMANAQTIKSRIGQAVGAQQALINATGAPSTMNNGQTIQPGLTGGLTSNAPGSFAPSGAPTQQLLSPQDLTAPRTIGITPGGAPITGTTAQQLGQLGVGQDGQPLKSPLGTGRLPTALMNPNRAGGPAAAPAAPAAAPGIVTSLSPAQQAAQTQTGGNNATAFAKMQDDGTKAQQQGAVLGNMLADTTKFASGQTDLNAVKGTIQKYAPGLAASLGVNPDSVAANESFDKLANQIADAQGAGSDARLAVNQGANPSSHLSPQGVDLILRQLQGNADYTRARAKMASAYPDQSDRAGFESTQGSKIDPRAFQFDRMTPAQRTTYAKSLSDTDKKAVQKAYVQAGQMGLLASGWTPNGQ